MEKTELVGHLMRAFRAYEHGVVKGTIENMDTVSLRLAYAHCREALEITEAARHLKACLAREVR